MALIVQSRAYFKGFQVVGHIGGKKNRGAEGWTLGRRKFQSFSNICLNMWVGGNESAEGTKLRLLKARSPYRLGGLGERRKRSDFSSGVWGGAPETDAILNTSCQNWVHFGMLLISYFLTMKSKK